MRALIVAALLSMPQTTQDAPRPLDATSRSPTPADVQFVEASTIDLTRLAQPAKYTTWFRTQVFRAIPDSPETLSTPEATTIRKALVGLEAGAKADFSSIAAFVQSCLDAEQGHGRIQGNEHPHEIAYTPDLTLQSWGPAGKRMLHQLGSEWYLQYQEATGVVTAQDLPCPVLVHKPSAVVGLMAIGPRGVAEVRTAKWSRIRESPGGTDLPLAGGLWRRAWEGAEGAWLVLEIDGTSRISAAAVLAGPLHVNVSILERVKGQDLPARTWNARLTKKALLVEEITIRDVLAEVGDDDLRLPVPATATLRDQRKKGNGAVHAGLQLWPEDLRSFVKPVGAKPAGDR